MAEVIEFKVNGKPVRASASVEQSLLWFLRLDLGLTGTKYGCGEAFCGACTVLKDKRPVRSCRVHLKDVAGAEIVTIEGLARDGRLHAIQRAFIEQDAFQCGFCTPGMVLEAFALLEKNPKPTEDDIKQGLGGHLCRCGAYAGVVRAVQAAAREVSRG
jgi:aerobic-type carbon monoxide dehydrogenase small subunit (CoxS/CutS family)